MMTAYGAIDIAVESLKKGAYDFITKPLDVERLVHLLNKCIQHQTLIRKNILLEKQLFERQTKIIGESKKIKNILNQLKIIAKSDLTALITGESGTGKELAAKTIHEWSPRKEKKLIIVNCPAIPESLLESELFGYKKGAFTQAMADKKGLFEIADKGSIFLDEIGDLSINLQTKLLRFLQEGEIRPVGENRTKKVDVRIIAATNHDLQKKIEKDLFREDLYYRLNVVNIRMPSLYEIKEDIPIIANFFLNEFCIMNNIPQKTFSPEAMDLLVNFNWTGNIRELKNIVQRTALFSSGNIISMDEIKFDKRGSSKAQYFNEISHLNVDLLEIPYHQAKEQILRDFSVDYLSEHLKKTKGNVTLAAQMSGLDRQYFQQLMRKYNILSERFRLQ